MSTLILLALVLGSCALLAALVATVRGDGLGHRPPPRSHPSELPRWRQLVL